MAFRSGLPPIASEMSCRKTAVDTHPAWEAGSTLRECPFRRGHPFREHRLDPCRERGLGVSEVAGMVCFLLTDGKAPLTLQGTQAYFNTGSQHWRGRSSFEVPATNIPAVGHIETDGLPDYRASMTASRSTAAITSSAGSKVSIRSSNRHNCCSSPASSPKLACHSLANRASQ